MRTVRLRAGTCKSDPSPPLTGLGPGIVHESVPSGLRLKAQANEMRARMFPPGRYCDARAGLVSDEKPAELVTAGSRVADMRGLLRSSATA
jgi:hypothetical protein